MLASCSVYLTHLRGSTSLNVRLSWQPRHGGLFSEQASANQRGLVSVKHTGYSLSTWPVSFQCSASSPWGEAEVWVTSGPQHWGSVSDTTARKKRLLPSTSTEAWCRRCTTRRVYPGKDHYSLGLHSRTRIEMTLTGLYYLHNVGLVWI